MKWTIYLLVGTLVALIPCVLYPEFITVFSLWEDWDYTHNRPHVAYSGANPPPVLRVVQPVFATIVLPPTQIAERLGARRGIYSYFAAQHAGLVPLGGSFHYNPPGPDRGWRVPDLRPPLLVHRRRHHVRSGSRGAEASTPNRQLTNFQLERTSAVRQEATERGKTMR
jgi:hypothetical protein